MFLLRQWLLITFGTSGCDPNGRITGGTQKMVLAFIENNMEQYAMDAARGEGETIDTLAGIMNVDSKVLAQKSKDNFAFIFPDENADAVSVTLALLRYWLRKAICLLSQILKNGWRWCITDRLCSVGWKEQLIPKVFIWLMMGGTIPNPNSWPPFRYLKKAMMWKKFVFFQLGMLF